MGDSVLERTKLKAFEMRGQLRQWQRRAIKAEALVEELVNKETGLRPIRTIVEEAATELGVETTLIYGRSITAKVVTARRKVFYDCYLGGHSLTFMETVFKRHYSTILQGMYLHAIQTGQRVLTNRVYKSWSDKYVEEGRAKARDRSRRRRQHLKTLKAAAARGALRSGARPPSGIAVALRGGSADRVRCPSP